MLDDPTQFEHLIKIKSVNVQGVGDCVLEATHMRPVRIDHPVGKPGNHRIKLENILMVPGLGVNLLSAEKIMMDGNYSICFRNGSCYFETHANDTVVKIPRDPELKLTALFAAQHGKHSPAMADVIQQAVRNFHAKAGHIGCSMMLKIVNTNFKNFFPSSMAKSDARREIRRMASCPACKVGKMTLPSFPASLPTTTKPLELIHSDVVGPINPASHYVERLEDSIKIYEI